MQIKFIDKSIMLKKANVMKFWLWIRSFPFFPLFLSIYAILFFLVYNIAQVDNHVADRLLLVFSLLTLFLLFIMRLVLRDIQRAGLVVFVFGLIFFTYPHIKFVLQGRLPILVNFHILFAVSIIFLAGTFLVAIKVLREKLAVLSIYLNGITLILVLIQLTSIFTYEYKMTAYWRNAELQALSPSARVIPRNDSLPDVYFIVLDGYARADVLQNELNLDNSPFLDALRKRQFYVADCSMSNYAQTEQSFASTLNMIYLDGIISRINDTHLREDYFAPYITNNLVRQYFESLGYKTVAFYTGYSWAEWNNATYFLGDPRSTKTTIVKSLVPFESSFLSRTIFSYMMDDLTYLGVVKPSQVAPLKGSEVDRGIVRYTLSELPVVAQLRGPKFVFAHILLPHPPYVFGPNGEEQNLSNDGSNIARLHQGYRDQTLYANKRILPIIDTILAESKGNAIIVLEGDHGIVDYMDGAEHMKNLEAYYFPDHDYSDLYPSITPVNSFRVILSDYFGQDYPLLKDQSYFARYSSDKTFTLISNPCNGK
jgi:hypothetical protein